MTSVYDYAVPPLRGSAFSFSVSLVSAANSNIFKTSPTIAAGDVTVSKDGGALANISSLPVEISNGVLRVSLTAAEMTADDVVIRFHDVTGTSGSQWQDLLVAIQTYQTITLPSAADNADAVWDETLADHLGVGSTGEGLNNTNTTTPPTAAFIADTVWDELIADHLGAGSTGATLNSAGSASDPLLNVVPGSYAAGTGGWALGRIGSGQIAVTSIVALDGKVTTYQGDAYSNTDGRAIDWTDTSVSWPVLTGATITVIIDNIGSFTGSVVTATGSSKKVRLELTSAQNTFVGKLLPYQVIATLTSGRIVTLVDSYWTSIDRKSVL